MNITKLYNTLNKSQLEELVKLYQKNISQTVSTDKFEDTTTNSFMCPHCKSIKVCKNGKRNKTQTYKCLECKKRYTIKTKTLFSSTKKDISVWKEYIKLMFEGKPIRTIALMLNINVKTSFYWRHKILKTLSSMKLPKLNGTIEADETYFNLSFKGKKKGMKRKPHLRGGAIHKRGLSREKVCVACAIDRNKNIMGKSICLGKVRLNKLSVILDKNINFDKSSLLITDGEKSYGKYALKNKINIKQLVGGKSKKKSIHIQNINSHHSALKKWIRRFNGVATKNLDNYLVFFKIMKTIKSGVFDEVIKLFDYTTNQEITDLKMSLV